MIRKKRKSSKYIFILKNINIEKIYEKYGIILDNNIVNSENIPNNSTKLTEINMEKPLELISFIDESKKSYQCIMSMLDFNTHKNIQTLKYNCYWCRHPFNTYPIGCPINYISNKITKSYHSEINKYTYIIKENISKTKLLNKNNDINTPFKFTVLKNNNSTFDIKQDEFFFTDGCFCSFNCCKAFIKDNKNNSLYQQSDILLTKIFNDIMNKDVKNKKLYNINPAPSWKLLKEYGGHMDITTFRNSFNKIMYESHGMFKPVGYLFEEKINF